VRAFAAALLAALVLVVGLADPLACPDGCADDPPASAASLATSTCSFCHGWSGATAVIEVAVVRVALPADTPPDPSLRPAFAPRIDHPPRRL